MCYVIYREVTFDLCILFRLFLSSICFFRLFGMCLLNMLIGGFRGECDIVIGLVFSM